MRELDRREGTAGQKLQLTVDANLQSYIKARLGEESASVVVMDCKTGRCAPLPLPPVMTQTNLCAAFHIMITMNCVIMITGHLPQKQFRMPIHLDRPLKW